MKIYKICEEKLYYLEYSTNTIKVYLSYIDEFLTKIGKHYSRLNANDFEQYLKAYNYTSTSQKNQVISAIQFLYKHGLNKKYRKVSFQRPREESKLPQVIDKNHILQRIDSIKNIKHKAIISLAYSVGLRVSEVINLKVKDIDSDRMIINIKNAKGRKDRIVPLTLNMLHLLRVYYKHYRPIDYLFNGQFSNQYSQTSCNNIVKKYLGHQYHFHLLRHSCFTNLTDEGIDIRVIQKLAGHKSSKTTEIYTHVSNSVLKKLPLAL